MPYLDRKDYSLYFEAADAGKPVLLFSHPLGCHSGFWDEQVEHLRERFRIVRYDHPGHGRSSLWPQVPAFDQYGQDVLALLDHLEIDSVYFCGLSLGGMVGQWLAANAPERVKKAVLANTCARIEDTTLLRGRIQKIREEGNLDCIVQSVINGWLSPAFQTSNPTEVEKVKALLLSHTAEAYAATAEVVCSMDLRSFLSGIDIPVLVIGGRHDAATPPAWNHALAEAIPGAEYREMETAHLSNIEAPGEFGDLLERFLTD